MNYTQVEVADLIMKAINALTIEGKKSEELITAKANAMGEYDKNIAIATTELKAKGEPATLIDRIAKGRTSDLLIKKIVAEETLKAHYSKLERLEAQLNGYQSVNRYLDTVSRGTNG
jgi:hypothetical protein